jgi:hypothetical protein
LISTPVFFCDQLNAALRDSADRWLAAHADELLEYLKTRLEAEIGEETSLKNSENTAKAERKRYHRRTLSGIYKKAKQN